MRCFSTFRLVFAFLAASRFAPADIVSFSGVITQSPQDSGNPAQNNPSLNYILDGDVYNVFLNFTGSILSPGIYTNFHPPNPCLVATGSAACFIDSTTGAIETNFGAISLTVTSDVDGIHDDLSLLACLNSRSGCLFGNQLDANFQILASNLNSHNAPAAGLDQPHPLNLLEDDGVTDIQGTVTAYSYTPTSEPEPSSMALVGIALAGLASKAVAARVRVKSRR